MAPENSTTQITSGSRGLKVMVIIFVTSYVVLAGTVGFLVYRVGTAAEKIDDNYRAYFMSSIYNNYN